MTHLTKQGAPLKALYNIAEAALKGAGRADDLIEGASTVTKSTLKNWPIAARPTTAATGAAATARKGGRFTNWVKPFATATAINTAAGGLPLYQTLLTLRKFLAGKGMRLTKDRIAHLENAIANAKKYERAPLVSKLNQQKYLNGLARQYYEKKNYPGIWAGAILSVPAAYGANKAWDWLNWFALDKQQQDVLTAQGEKPTTVGQDVNNIISRFASYYKGIKQLPEGYMAEANKHPMLENIRDNRPIGIGDRADKRLRELKQQESMLHGRNEFDLGHQSISMPYDPNNHVDSTPQLPTYTNGITYDPNTSSTYEHNPPTSITMRR